MARPFKNLYKRLAKIPYVNRWGIFAFDLLLSCFCTMFSYIVIGHLFNQTVLWNTTLLIGFCSVLAGSVGFLLFKTYKNIIRHSSFQSLWRITAAIIVKMIIVSAVYLSNPPFLKLNYLIAAILLDTILSFFILTITRLVVVFFYSFTIADFIKSKKKVLIYCTAQDNLSASHLTDLYNTLSDYIISGFLRFAPKSKTYFIGNLPVFEIEKTSNLSKIIDKENLQGILFTKKKDILDENNRLVSYCLDNKLTVLTMLPMGDWQPTTSKSKLRNLDIADLLGRDEIHISATKIEQDLTDKSVLVTGAAGSIGSELCRQIAAYRIRKLVLLDNCETGLHNLRLELEEKFPNLELGVMIGDVRSNDRLKYVFERHLPQIVFHAAAYKHVPLMEENPNEAFLVNTIGTRNIAHISLEYHVEKFLMVSTDKAVNPTNVMGASKRLAEIYVQSLNQAVKEGLLPGKTQYITTRFGNVLGSQGSVIPRFKDQIEKGGPVTVTHPEITRYFMTIKEACLLMLEASVIGNGGNILVFDMGTPVKISDLAKKMISLFGEQENNIKIKYTGLRPGEKLYEEVLSSKEHTLPTSHEKIRIAKATPYVFNDLQPLYDRLESITRACRSEEAVRIAKEIVPEYISNNSEFSKFDRK